jgi:hypothetical protein
MLIAYVEPHRLLHCHFDRHRDTSAPISTSEAQHHRPPLAPNVEGVAGALLALTIGGCRRKASLIPRVFDGFADLGLYEVGIGL